MVKSNSRYLCLFPEIINFSYAAAVINGIDLLISILLLGGVINVSKIFGELIKSRNERLNRFVLIMIIIMITIKITGK